MNDQTPIETTAERNTRLAAMGHYAWTGSRMVNILDPDPDDLILEEITMGLSREPRYGGSATAVPWTVAQHCLLVVHYAEEDGVTSPDLLLTMLLHDAPEYMLRDLISPVKRYCPDYKGIEDVWWAAIARKFRLPFKMPGIVKHYDYLACASEKATLISPDAGDWPGLPDPRPIPASILALTPMQAKGRFEGEIRKAMRGSFFKQKKQNPL